MNRTHLGTAICSLLVLATPCCTSVDPSKSGNESAGSSDPGRFYSPRLCINCHQTTAEGFTIAEHSTSFTTEVFQSVYRGRYLGKLHAAPDDYQDEPSCLSCHAPMLYVQADYSEYRECTGRDCGECHFVPPEACWTSDWTSVLDPPEDTLARWGVSCDFCHTITGTRGSTVGNANFISTPGDTKYGPLPPLRGRAWHHQWSSLHTKAEMCGMCHESTNRFGVPIRTTYSEWLSSPQANRSVVCQDCHMSEAGHLVDGKPVYRTGAVAEMTIVDVPTDRLLHSHRFPGAKDTRQTIDSITLEIDPLLRPTPNGFQVEVVIKNDRAAHRLPTGSAGRHSVWLEMTAESGNWQIHGTAISSQEESDYSTLGKTGYDTRVYGPAAPTGARVYRSVYIESGGLETVDHFDAAECVFDNRLYPDERRRETFSFVVPQSLGPNTVILRATASLIRLPPGLAADLQVLPEEPVQIASALISAR